MKARRRLCRCFLERQAQDYDDESEGGKVEKNVIVEKCHEENYEKLMKKLSSAAQRKISSEVVVWRKVVNMRWKKRECNKVDL
jgi:hypothetical protein